MKTKIRKVPVFIAEDGMEFLSEPECIKYETTELKRWRNIRYFYVVHSPDLTEGRGWGRITYVAIESEFSADCYANLYCEQEFGSRVAFVQGCSPMFSWMLQETIKATFKTAKPGNIGDYKQEVKRVFLSNNGPLKGLLDPIPLRHKSNNTA